ncbi:phosphotransferase enzyme family protein [Bacillus chungangensis]|uniref:Ser/Thr protein kinase RdoA (MazF antagonist) n=1 Tax=Bacillus chungangensis TaxID=587633 RepID=A0ABT9WSY8_9BACI|nr:phosphotransferase [Bacillus chungangensis]MDQ0176407.1 Ser/Thr protein kinase RdoA (MazF antagonist) [Bacillus chungangensis]
MMRLSTMKKVVATVDENWRSPLAEKILERWGYDPGSVYYFRSSANFVFVFSKEGKDYYLRFNEACERSLKTVEAETEILRYLCDKPIRTAQPVPSLNQKYVETIETELGTFYAVVFEALQGNQFEMEKLDKDHFYKWGSTLGRLHHIFKTMPEEYRDGRPSWKDRLQFAKTMLADEETYIKNELELVFQWAEGLQVSNEHFGMIHYDFELDNLNWEKDAFGVLDFDDCRTHWYVADIAYALRELSEYDVDLENPFVQSFISGYKTETELDMGLLKEIKWLMRMHNLESLASLLRSVDLTITSDDPDWLSELKEDLLGYIEEYRDFIQQLHTNKESAKS